jgi:serine O-acetyltransferase
LNINNHISDVDPDWSREYKSLFSWDPSRSLLASIRSYQKYKNAPLFFFFKKIAVLRHCFWSVITGADIPINSKIGGGLMMPHPNGIVIHPDAIIGPNCLIFQQVTIGTVDGSAKPIIEGHVDIGAGAKVLGGVRVGAHAKIGANAVVLIDVPAGKTAIGIPAKLRTERM